MADETPAPLSDAEIDAIRARIDAWLAVAEPRDGGEVDMRLPVLGLLATLAARDAEVAALRAENTAYREIVTPLIYGRAIDVPDYGPALFHVGEDWPARQAQARALLATSTSPADGKEGN